MKSQLRDFIVEAVKTVPSVKPLLSAKARFALHTSDEYKSQEYFLQQIERLVRTLYSGIIGGQFIDLMANLISGQLFDAYSRAWQDYGEFGAIPAYLEAGYQEDVLAQYEHVDKYYRDIVDAQIDQTPIDPLLARAGMWANQWNASYQKAREIILMQTGGNFTWHKGQTEQGCDTCAHLDGITMSAKEWDALQLHPRGYPNPKLQCEGGGPANNCDCSLDPTDKRRTPGAFGRVEEILLIYGK